MAVPVFLSWEVPPSQKKKNYIYNISIVKKYWAYHSFLIKIEHYRPLSYEYTLISPNVYSDKSSIIYSSIKIILKAMLLYLLTLRTNRLNLVHSQPMNKIKNTFLHYYIILLNCVEDLKYGSSSTYPLLTQAGFYHTARCYRKKWDFGANLH